VMFTPVTPVTIQAFPPSSDQSSQLSSSSWSVFGVESAADTFHPYEGAPHLAPGHSLLHPTHHRWTLSAQRTRPSPPFSLTSHLPSRSAPSTRRTHQAPSVRMALQNQLNLSILTWESTPYQREDLGAVCAPFLTEVE